MDEKAEELIKRAEDRVVVAQKNLADENYYAVAFLCKEAAEYVLQALYWKQFSKAPPSDIVISLPTLSLTGEMKEYFQKLLRVYNPIFLTSRKLPADFIVYTQKTIAYAKNSP